MYGDALLSYAHFLSIFFLAWFLARQWLLLRAGYAALDVETLARTDLGYFISAGLVLLTGLGRLFLGAKPLAFYTHNGAFHALIGLFVVVGLISIIPTMNYQRWRRYRREDTRFEIPAREWWWMRVLVGVELFGLAIMPLAAVLMARGI
jgi:putative membrane protein